MRNNATAIAMLRKLTRSIHFVTFSLKWLCLWEYVSTSESVSMPYITRLRISKFCQPIMSTKNVKQIMMMRKRSRLGFSGFAAGSFGGAILRCIFLYCLAMDQSPIFLVRRTQNHQVFRVRCTFNKSKIQMLLYHIFETFKRWTLSLEFCLFIV